MICKSLDIPVYSENATQIIYYTGDKNKNALDGSPKLYFYKQTKTYFGYTASRAYDIIGLVQARLSLLSQPCSFWDGVNYILSVTGRQTTEIQRVSKPNICDWQSGLERYVRVRNGESILKTYDDGFLNDFPDFLPKEWLNEGISVETAIKYGLKYYERTNQVLIPCRNENGELIGVRCRNFNPQRIEQAKYIPLTLLDGTSYAFPTNNVFYGINYTQVAIERTQTVTIVESEKATMKLDTWYGENNNALGMFGHNLGLKRRNQLIKMGVKRVIYVPDNDWIGRSPEYFVEWKKGVKSFIDLWLRYAQVEIVWDTLDILQPKENAVDQSKEVWEKLFNNREIC